MPKFSIIIPVYNVAPYLRECLDSVLAQTFTDWEAICVDDGSSDGSSAILDGYAAKDNRFRVIHQANAGVSVARNKALDVMKGRYFLFLDGDDLLTRSLLSQLSRILDKRKELDAICYSTDVFGSEAIGFAPSSGIPSGDYSGDELIRLTIKKGASYIWVVWDKVFNVDVLIRNNLRFLENLKLGEDSLFAQMFIAAATKFRVEQDLIGYKYRMREGSAIHSPKRDSLRDDPFREFRELSAWEKKVGGVGIKRIMRLHALGLVFLGRGRFYSSNVRNEGIEYLLNSKYFTRKILPFLLFNGTLKSRIFALFYLISFRFFRKLLLRMI